MFYKELAAKIVQSSNQILVQDEDREELTQAAEDLVKDAIRLMKNLGFNKIEIAPWNEKSGSVLYIGGPVPSELDVDTFYDIPQ
jgi:hypothetical protein